MFIVIFSKIAVKCDSYMHVSGMAQCVAGNALPSGSQMTCSCHLHKNQVRRLFRTYIVMLWYCFIVVILVLRQRHDIIYFYWKWHHTTQWTKPCSCYGHTCLVFARPISTASVIQMSCVAVSHYNNWNWTCLFTVWNTYSLNSGLWLWICSWAELLLSVIYYSYLSLLSMSSTLTVGGARNGIWPELLVRSRESPVLHVHDQGTIPCVGPGCVLCIRIDPLRFLAGCRKRRLNQGLFVALGFFLFVR